MGKRLVLLILIALFAVTEAGPALAQSEDRIEVAQQQKRRTLFDLLFGDDKKAEPPPRVQQTQPRATTPRASTPAPALPPPKPTIEKASSATRLAVFGDSLAVDLAKALERFYAEDPNLVVIDQGVGSSGFVRDDYFDWNKAIADQIAADSFNVAVVVIGINDRQDLRVDGQSYAPLTDDWIAAYRSRLDAFLTKLRAARKPVIWVGLPPMSKSSYSAAMTQISALQRLAAFSGGAEFLDIYDRFLGEDGQYAAYGPDVNGQNARMRKDDGIHFASAGADKLAFYISQSVRTFYRGGAVTLAVADPLQGTDAAAMLRPPYQGQGQIRLLEVAGAVMPLSRSPDRASDLISASSAPGVGNAFPLEALTSAPKGRVDAFGVGVDPAAETDENGTEP